MPRCLLYQISGAAVRSIQDRPRIPVVMVCYESNSQVLQQFCTNYSIIPTKMQYKKSQVRVLSSFMMVRVSKKTEIQLKCDPASNTLNSIN